MAFFELHLGRPRGLRERLRLLLGRLFHATFFVSDRLRGLSREEPVSLEVGKDVMLRGRADALVIERDVAKVIERKSSRPPRRGAWASDVLQASAYGFILLRGKGLSEVSLELRYPTVTRVFKMDERITSTLLMAIDDLILVKRHGIVPAAKRGPRCNRCPYRDVCLRLDEELKPDEGEVFEPGSWLRELNVLE